MFQFQWQVFVVIFMRAQFQGSWKCNYCVWLVMCACMWVCVLTVHVQPLHDDGELHLTGHVTQGAHGHTQFLLGDESIAVAVEHTERLADLYTGTQQHILLSPPHCKRLLVPVRRTTTRIVLSRSNWIFWGPVSKPSQTKSAVSLTGNKDCLQRLAWQSDGISA